MAASETDGGVDRILADNTSLERHAETNKVRCRLSGHEMPCRLDTIRQYLAGKKFKKLKAAEDLKGGETAVSHLVTSNKKGRERQLFCQLTWRHLNNEPGHIQRHLVGKRFQKALAKWKQCQLTGEKFYPRGRPSKKLYEDTHQLERYKKRVSDLDRDESGDNNDESDTDSYSDLYPVAEFGGTNSFERAEENGDDLVSESEEDEPMEVGNEDKVVETTDKVKDKPNEGLKRKATKFKKRAVKKLKVT